MVVMHILSKSLARFRCVRKPWSSSFQTSASITKHHQNNLRNKSLNILVKRCHGCTKDDIPYFSALSTQKDKKFSVTENIHLPFFSGHCDPQVFGHCNGLVCLYEFDNVALWNPSTREFKTLPQSSVKRPPIVDMTVVRFLGFGFDSKTDDYKVLRLVTNFFNSAEDQASCPEWIEQQLELYSLKLDSWKEIPFPKEAFHNTLSVFNNYVNGFCYWQAIENSVTSVVSFDLADEKFSTFPLPNFGGSFARNRVELLDFNGSLGAIVFPMEGNEKSIDLWVMNNGSWTREFSIDSVPRVETPLGFWENGELFFESSNHELVLFDPATRELKNLGVDSYPHKMTIVPYVESSVPINGRPEHEEGIIRRPATVVK